MDNMGLFDLNVEPEDDLEDIVELDDFEPTLMEQDQ
jgi:hypothetical protein